MKRLDKMDTTKIGEENVKIYLKKTNEYDNI